VLVLPTVGFRRPDLKRKDVLPCAGLKKWSPLPAILPRTRPDKTACMTSPLTGQAVTIQDVYISNTEDRFRKGEEEQPLQV
jgi:hypothetical protein